MMAPRRFAGWVFVAALAVSLAVPGVAAAVNVSGQVKNSVTTSPVVGARVGAYAVPPGGYAIKGGDPGTTITGDYLVDVPVGSYVMRVGRPGYITQDLPQFNVPGPIAGKDVFLVADPLRVERTWGADRYSTAVQVARERFTSPAHPAGWWGVDTVVIASGEDRAAADPLAAAGLCGAYGDTPLFLVSSSSVPSSVKAALNEISQTRMSPVRVVVVGGPASVPDARLGEIATAMPHGATLDRLVTAGDRFTLAAAIAQRIATVKGSAPTMALVANGADPEKFFDALALSTVAASKDIPILLVNENSVPAATRNALDQLGGAQNIYIGGGPATVSNAVQTELDQQYGTVERWAGGDRYWTAIAIADNALAKGWLIDDLVGVSAKLPDALTGGATLGQTRGVLLITNGETLTPSTGNWLLGHKGEIDKCYVIGGPVSVTSGVMSGISSKLH